MMLTMARKSLRTSYELYWRRLVAPRTYNLVKKAEVHSKHIPPTAEIITAKILKENNGIINNECLQSPKRELTKDEELQEFFAIFPEVLNDLIDADNNRETMDANNWLKTVVESNVFNGTFGRALLLISAFKFLAPPEKLTPENIRLVKILAWCFEILQIFLMMLDDMIDGSDTRRNQVCWHLRDGIGLSAMNDAVLVENAVYVLLDKHFRDKPYYTDLLNLFHKGVFNCYKGQCIEILLSGQYAQKLDVNRITMDQFELIAKYKTGHYAFILPFSLAMLMAGIREPDLYKQAENVLVPIASFYQAENDYLDCYGDLHVSKKIGNDIQSGKCTWLAAKALQKCSPEQREMMQQCYGTEDAANVARVRALYEELGLRQEFANYVKSSCTEIRNKIENISPKLPRELFYKLLERFKTF